MNKLRFDSDYKNRLALNRKQVYIKKSGNAKVQFGHLHVVG